MKNSVKIILAVAVFLVFVALGYFVMPSYTTNSDNSLAVDVPSDYRKTESKSLQNDEPLVGTTPKADEDNVGKASLPNDSSNTTVKHEQPEEPEPITTVNITPEIRNVVVGQLSSSNYRKIGRTLSVNATVMSQDNLEYKLYEIGSNVAKYTSNTGWFPDVYPVDGGKYLLRVVNSRTGAFAERQVSGFNKIDKYTASGLQTMLNSDTQERLFYLHFDTDELRFDCEGINADEKPASLNALLSSRSANGWNYVVVGTPQYDQYNRITYFRVRVTE